MPDVELPPEKDPARRPGGGAGRECLRNQSARISSCDDERQAKSLSFLCLVDVSGTVLGTDTEFQVKTIAGCIIVGCFS